MFFFGYPQTGVISYFSSGISVLIKLPPYFLMYSRIYTN